MLGPIRFHLPRTLAPATGLPSSSTTTPRSVTPALELDGRQHLAVGGDLGHLDPPAQLQIALGHVGVAESLLASRSDPVEVAGGIRLPHERDRADGLAVAEPDADAFGGLAGSLLTDRAADPDPGAPGVR